MGAVSVTHFDFKAVLICLAGVLLLAITPGGNGGAGGNSSNHNHTNITTPDGSYTLNGTLDTVIAMVGSSSSSSSSNTNVHVNAGILMEAAAALTMAVYYVAFQRWGLRQGTYPAGIVAIITGTKSIARTSRVLLSI